MQKLTNKQTLFLNYLLQGNTKLDAYRKAYGNSTGSDASIKVSASRVFNSDNFQEHYLKATKILQEKAMYNRQNAVEDLKLVINAAKEDLKKNGLKFANSTALIKSVEALNNLLMLSKESTEKLEIERDKLEFAKSKVQQDNDTLQKDNANLLRQLIDNAANK